MVIKEVFVAESMEELIKHKMQKNYDGCVKISGLMLAETGHIPIVTNVSMGVGYCAFYAKLTEFIGVKSWFNFMADRFSGKGKDVHKLMGLLCLEVFPDSQNAEKAYSAAERIASEDLQLTGDDKSIALGASKSLIKNLLNDIDRLCEITGADRNNLYPIVEQQFIDYSIHMRGIPDLILEDKENGKAIVIDWKTAPKQRNGPIKVYDNEDAQVIAYSLFEAARLEKRDLRSSITAKDNKVDILQVIVRTGDNGLWSPNPVLSGDSGSKSLDRYNALISNVLLEAQYLTSLLAYVRKEKLSPGEISLCKTKVDWSDIPQNMITLMPEQLTRRGSPSKQKTFPCALEGGYECAVKGPCHFYYGRGVGIRKDYERDMWSLRYKTLKRKEDSLIAYRAIYDIFKYHKSPLLGYSAIDWIKKGKGFQYPGGGGMPHSIDRPQILGPDSQVISRVDIVDSVEFDEDEEDFILKAERPIRPYEKEDYFIIPIGKTILLTFMDSWSPFLSISLFGNIREIIPDENRISYTISVPSKIFQYQMRLFKRYLKKRGPTDSLFMFEIGADLTQIELSGIDALQQLLDPENQEEEQKLDKEHINEIKREEEYISTDDEDEDTGENASVLMDVFRYIAERSSGKKGGH